MKTEIDSHEIKPMDTKDYAFIQKVHELIKDHARQSPGRVIGNIQFNWTQVGYVLMLNGSAVEFKEKPKRS